MVRIVAACRQLRSLIESAKEKRQFTSEHRHSATTANFKNSISTSAQTGVGVSTTKEEEAVVVLISDDSPEPAAMVEYSIDTTPDTDSALLGQGQAGADGRTEESAPSSSRLEDASSTHAPTASSTDEGLAQGSVDPVPADSQHPSSSGGQNSGNNEAGHMITTGFTNEDIEAPNAAQALPNTIKKQALAAPEDDIQVINGFMLVTYLEFFLLQTVNHVFDIFTQIPKIYNNFR